MNFEYFRIKYWMCWSYWGSCSRDVVSKLLICRGTEFVRILAWIRWIDRFFMLINWLNYSLDSALFYFIFFILFYFLFYFILFYFIYLFEIGWDWLIVWWVDSFVKLIDFIDWIHWLLINWWNWYELKWASCLL